MKSLFEQLKIPEVIKIDSEISGPKVVFFGSIHGNEPSGRAAIERLFFDLSSGFIKLKNGSVTLGRGNRIAINANKRYVQYNLNRLFKNEYAEDMDMNSYEFKRAQELKTVLEDADYFLDLHSASIANEPFVIVEKQHVDFFSKLGIGKMITGWSKFSDSTIAGDTENFANNHGVVSATLESGSHFDINSYDLAYETVIKMLINLGMIDINFDLHKLTSQKSETYEMMFVQTKEYNDFKYVDEPKPFQLYKSGEVIAIQNSQPIIVHEDLYILLPTKNLENVKIGEEVYYLGRLI